MLSRHRRRLGAAGSSVTSGHATPTFDRPTPSARAPDVPAPQSGEAIQTTHSNRGSLALAEHVAGEFDALPVRRPACGSVLDQPSSPGILAQDLGGSLKPAA